MEHPLVAELLPHVVQPVQLLPHVAHPIDEVVGQGATQAVEGRLDLNRETGQP